MKTRTLNFFGSDSDDNVECPHLTTILMLLTRDFIRQQMLGASPEPRTPARTPDPGPRTPDPGPRTPDPGSRTPDPGPRIPDPGPRTPDPGPRTPGVY
jgi:hypothetical protein